MNSKEQTENSGEQQAGFMRNKRFWRHLRVEQHLLNHDLAVTLAHVRMLGATGIIDSDTASTVLSGLSQIEQELSAGNSFLKEQHTDIHSALEERLRELIGDLSATLRIARSKHDQVATDIRLWLRAALLDIFALILELRGQLVVLAERDLEIVMPGYTHMQPARPILLAHWWLANESRFASDCGRLTDLYRRLNVLPLGAAAGTDKPIDRAQVCAELGFDDLIDNSLYAISDRDYLVEFGSFASLVGVHIAQIADDLLLWATQEFGFVKLRNALLLGSQSAPKKSGQVALELMRSRPAGIAGRLVEFIAILKAVPIGYCQDLQECLPAAFDIVDNIKLLLELSAAVVPAVELNALRMREMASADLTNSGAAMDFLVDCGIPIDRASKVVEQLLNYCKQRNKNLCDLELNEWQQFCPAFDEEIYQHVTIEESVGSPSYPGSTLLDQIGSELDRAKGRLEQDKNSLSSPEATRKKQAGLNV